MYVLTIQSEIRKYCLRKVPAQKYGFFALNALCTHDYGYYFLLWPTVTNASLLITSKKSAQNTAYSMFERNTYEYVQISINRPEKI